MDAYLALADVVLRTVRRPLTAREILKFGYEHDLVPSRLHGKTQTKTLGARLSEDILLRRERSAFFRTEPGRFFLRCFIADPSLPQKYRTPIIARRRQRELVRGRALALSRHVLRKEGVGGGESALQLLRGHRFHYVPSLKERTADDVLVWSFVVVTRGDEVLTYRHGRYREDRDSFLRKRSIGFFTPVLEESYDLFDRGDRGVVASGLRAVLMDLDMPPEVDEKYDERASLLTFISPLPNDSVDILAVVKFECPDWFEPVGRRLAINDLTWMSMLAPVNHLEDFDPWSQKVLERALRSGTGETAQENASVERLHT